MRPVGWRNIRRCMLSLAPLVCVRLEPRPGKPHNPHLCLHDRSSVGGQALLSTHNTGENSGRARTKYLLVHNESAARLFFLLGITGPLGTGIRAHKHATTTSLLQSGGTWPAPACYGFVQPPGPRFRHTEWIGRTLLAMIQRWATPTPAPSLHTGLLGTAFFTWPR